MFDLVSVVAIASVTQTLNHAISEGHGTAMLINFVALFAMIWRVWMNCTWFASAFDNGERLFFLLTITIVGRCSLSRGIEENKHIASLTISTGLNGSAHKTYGIGANLEAR